MNTGAPRLALVRELGKVLKQQGQTIPRGLLVRERKSQIAHGRAIHEAALASRPDGSRQYLASSGAGAKLLK